MYELIPAGAATYYLDAPVKTGIYQSAPGEVWLIDGGNDKDAGRRIRKVLDQKGWRLKAIIITHAHADHIGGSQYLKRQTGCKVYARGIERAFTEFPILEPSFLYGGFAPKDLRHKFLMAGDCVAEDIGLAVLPAGMEIISLPGHSFDMIGVRTPDDVVFLADCLSGKAALDKYQVTFLYDVEGFLDTLAKVEGLKGRLFLPAHTQAIEDTRTLQELVACNRQKVFEIRDKLLDICSRPVSFDWILKQIFTEYGLKMTFEQHALIGSTVKSYLAWLKGKDLVTAVFEDNMLLWQTHASK